MSCHLRALLSPPVTPICEACGGDDETVAHFLFDCPQWEPERSRLRQAAGRRWRDRAHLLSTTEDTEVIEAVLDYAKSTGWGSRGTRDDGGGRPEEGMDPASQEEEIGRHEDDGESE